VVDSHAYLLTDGSAEQKIVAVPIDRRVRELEDHRA